MPKPSRESVEFEVKAAPMVPMSISDSDRIVKAIFAVMGNVDLGNDRIMPGAFAKTIGDRLNSGNIKVLWQHNMDLPAIATPKVLKELSAYELPPNLKAACPEATGALYGEVEYLDTPRANEVLAGIRGGAITQNSIGFDAMRCSFERMDGQPLSGNAMTPDSVRNIEECRLWDISPVNFGMNPETMNMKTLLTKAAIPYKQTPTSDAAWDMGTMMGNCDGMGADLEAQMRSLCAWVDPNGNPQTKGAYKFPHHMVSGDGSVGAANIKACQSAIGVLNGGMGGAKIPEADRQSVYNHLAHHLRDAGVEPPQLKSLDGPDGIYAHAWSFVDYLARNEAEIKAGRVLSDANFSKIQAAHQHLSAVLESAAPSKTRTDDEKAAEIQSMLTRLGYMERELAAID